MPTEMLNARTSRAGGRPQACRVDHWHATSTRGANAVAWRPCFGPTNDVRNRRYPEGSDVCLGWTCHVPQGPNAVFLQAVDLSARNMAVASTIFVDPHVATSLSALGAMGNVACGRAPHALCCHLPCHVPKMLGWVKLRTTYGAPKGSLLDLLWDDFWAHFVSLFGSILVVILDHFWHT